MSAGALRAPGSAGEAGTGTGTVASMDAWMLAQPSAPVPYFIDYAAREARR